MAHNLYHRVGEQISSYAADQLPDFVRDLSDRIGGLKPVQAPQTHVQRMAQSDRGHKNPGPGKKAKGLGK